MCAQIQVIHPPVPDLVRDIVAGAAPDELPLVEGLRRLDPDTAVRRLARRCRRREPLEFGLQELVPLVTPVVWIAIDEAVRRSVDDVSGGAVRWLAALARRIMRRPAPVRRVAPLSAEQLDLVGRRVRELAAETGIRPARAAELAERVVGRLALPSGGGDSGGGDSGAVR